MVAFECVPSLVGVGVCSVAAEYGYSRSGMKRDGGRASGPPFISFFLHEGPIL